MSKKEFKKVILILLVITLSEGIWVFFNFWVNGLKFLKFLGFTANSTVSGWVLAFAVTFIFILQGLRLPSVKQYLFNLSLLKLLALLMAFTSAILEEAFFRKGLMDFLKLQGVGGILQVIACGLVFGLLHGIWGVFGRNMIAAVGATVSTGILGSALAIVYLASGRILAPSIVSHFVINALMEPGLVIAAVKGEMGGKKNLEDSSINR